MASLRTFIQTATGAGDLCPVSPGWAAVPWARGFNEACGRGYTPLRGLPALLGTAAGDRPQGQALLRPPPRSRGRAPRRAPDGPPRARGRVSTQRQHSRAPLGSGSRRGRRRGGRAGQGQQEGGRERGGQQSREGFGPWQRFIRSPPGSILPPFRERRAPCSGQGLQDGSPALREWPAQARPVGAP